jgi:hypothetical protein
MLWFSFVSERAATFRFQEARGIPGGQGLCRVRHANDSGQDCPLKVEESINAFGHFDVDVFLVRCATERGL